MNLTLIFYADVSAYIGPVRHISAEKTALCPARGPFQGFWFGRLGLGGGISA
jgi:hypothetical protein